MVAVFVLSGAFKSMRSLFTLQFCRDTMCDIVLMAPWFLLCYRCFSGIFGILVLCSESCLSDLGGNMTTLTAFVVVILVFLVSMV